MSNYSLLQGHVDGLCMCDYLVFILYFCMFYSAFGIIFMLATHVDR